MRLRASADETEERKTVGEVIPKLAGQQSFSALAAGDLDAGITATMIVTVREAVMSRSSRFVVATHVLSLLAFGEGEAMTSEYIAGSVNTNPVVVRRILALLVKAGLVGSQEGAGGGVRLAKPAHSINLRDVYVAVEPDPLFALHPQNPN